MVVKINDIQTVTLVTDVSYSYNRSVAPGRREGSLDEADGELHHTTQASRNEQTRRGRLNLMCDFQHVGGGVGVLGRESFVEKQSWARRF